jgi:hypothetical protein
LGGEGRESGFALASYPGSLADVILFPKIEDFLEASAESLVLNLARIYRDIQPHDQNNLLHRVIVLEVLFQ